MTPDSLPVFLLTKERVVDTTSDAATCEFDCLGILACLQGGGTLTAGDCGSGIGEVCCDGAGV